MSKTYADIRCPLCNSEPAYRLEDHTITQHVVFCPSCNAYYNSAKFDSLTSAEIKNLHAFSYGSWSQMSKSAALSGWKNMVKRFKARQTRQQIAEAAKSEPECALASIKHNYGPMSSAASSWLLGLLNLLNAPATTSSAEQLLASARAYAQLDK